MAIETKTSKDKAGTTAEKPAPLQFRDNPEVKKRIDAHKAANPQDVLYYTRLVTEAPQRAMDSLCYKDMQKHENEMRLIVKQLPQAKTFYDSQTPDAKARIDADLEGVNPYYADKAFVNAVIAAKDRQSRRELTAPTTGAAMNADGKIVTLPDQSGKPPRMAA
ncbi:MAG: hypothetical protein JWM32_3139 [Verrucomicrobia bacterium]|nr:hypothetical protein [Verrucomicrobiota bacterium]